MRAIVLDVIGVLGITACLGLVAVVLVKDPAIFGAVVLIALVLLVGVCMAWAMQRFREGSLFTWEA